MKKKTKKKRTMLNIESPDAQQNLRPEDFKNAKILPILNAAQDLLCKIRQKQLDIDLKIE